MQGSLAQLSGPNIFILMYSCVCTYTYIYIHTVSLALKVRSQRGTITRSTSQPWRERLISRSHQLTMNMAQINGLKLGLKFGKAIELPQELKLDAQMMRDLLIPHDTTSKCPRYFTHLKYTNPVYTCTCIKI